MENKRYNFGGFTFGQEGMYDLKIQVLNHSKTGTLHSTEIHLELTPAERQELITNLITLNAKVDN